MARIRSIKPDFWTDEKIVELSAFARLLFIGLWNFADDDGRIAYSPKKIKMQIFPADSLDISELFGEIRGESLIDVYGVDGVEYLQIVGFAKHQKIDKRSPSKLPENPLNTNTPTESPRIPTTEGKGREEDMEGKGIKAIAIGKPNCPHQEIINLYHEVLPASPRIKDWTPARAASLKARWNEGTDRQTLDYWRGLFEYISGIPFLTGRTPGSNGHKPFVLSLDWLLKAENFAKVREGRYEDAAA